MNTRGRRAGEIRSVEQALDVIFGGRVAKMLLDQVGDVNAVLQLSDGDLRGLGASDESIQLLNAAKFLKFKPLKEQVRSPQTALEYLKHLEFYDHEGFWMLCMDRSNRPIGELVPIQISEGGRAGAIVDEKLVLRKALIRGASSVIIAHNHPSGSAHPSRADYQVTEVLEAAFKKVKIHLFDHVIVTQNDRYFSFGEQGIGFSGMRKQIQKIKEQAA